MMKSNYVKNFFLINFSLIMHFYAANDPFRDSKIPLLSTEAELFIAINNAPNNTVVAIITYIPSIYPCINMAPNYIKYNKEVVSVSDRMLFYRIYTLNPITTLTYPTYPLGGPVKSYLKTKIVPSVKIFYNGGFYTTIDGFKSYTEYFDTMNAIYATLTGINPGA